MMETLDIDEDGNLVMEDFIRMRFLKDGKTKSQQTFQKIFENKNNISHLLILSTKEYFWTKINSIWKLHRPLPPQDVSFYNFYIKCYFDNF